MVFLNSEKMSILLILQSQSLPQPVPNSPFFSGFLRTFVGLGRRWGMKRVGRDQLSVVYRSHSSRNRSARVEPKARHFFLPSSPAPASPRADAVASLSRFFFFYPLPLFFFFLFPPCLPFTISPRRCIPRAGAEPVSPPASPRPPPPYGEREPPPHPGTSGGGWRSGTGGSCLRSGVVMELIR